jgi:glycosyltransferase involved in cell wall biosynthesis
MATQKKKKVLFVITKSNWGGAQRYVYDLATTLDKNHYEAVVALGGNGTLHEMLTHAGIRVIPLLQLKNTTGAKALFASLQELTHVIRSEKPTIVHLNSSVAGLLGTIAAKRARVPATVFTAHGWAFNEDRPLLQRLVIKTLHYLTVILADRTIAVSRAIVREMDWPGAERKMKVINPGRSIGVMYDRDAARTEIINRCPHLKPFIESTWIVCLAELHPIKRHHVLIAAFDQLRNRHPDIKLVLIGEGQERAHIESLITKHGLYDSVFLTGAVTEAARFLTAFNLCVLSSKSESYGYVLVEAGLAGVPVVATHVGGITDIITDQETGRLVAPDVVAALTEALEQTLTNQADTQRYRDQLKAVLSTRTVQRMTTQTTSLYQELIRF